jgi:hypothetical protein
MARPTPAPQPEAAGTRTRSKKKKLGDDSQKDSVTDEKAVLEQLVQDLADVVRLATTSIVLQCLRNFMRCDSDWCVAWYLQEI